MIGATIVWTIIIEFLFIFRCGTDFKANWGTIRDSQEHCGDENPRQVGFAVTDAFADLVLLVLPMPIVCISISLLFSKANDGRYGVCRCLSGGNLPSLEYCFLARCKHADSDNNRASVVLT